MTMLGPLLTLCLIMVGAWARRFPMGKIDDFKQQILDQHNALRRKPRADYMNRMVWDDALEQTAADWVKQCRFKTKDENGENLFARSVSDLQYNAGQYITLAINKWNEQTESYNQTLGTCMGPVKSGKYIHWRVHNLIVWGNSQRIGCAYTTCFQPKREFKFAYMFFACWYSPTGNVPGMAPYQTDENTCYGCKKNQKCKNGLCIGDVTCINKVLNRQCAMVKKMYVGVCESWSGPKKLEYMKKNCRRACKFCTPKY